MVFIIIIIFFLRLVMLLSRRLVLNSWLQVTLLLPHPCLSLREVDKKPRPFQIKSITQLPEVKIRGGWLWMAFSLSGIRD